MAKWFYVILVLLLAVYGVFSVNFNAPEAPLLSETGLLTGFIVYENGYGLGWSDTHKVTDSDRGPNSLFVAYADGKAVLTWKTSGNDIESAYYTYDAKSSTNTLVNDNGRSMHMDGNDVVWSDTATGSYKARYGILSSGKDAITDQELISSLHSVYCLANLSAHCDNTAGDDYTVYLDVKWQGGDYSDIWGNLQSIDSTSYAGIDSAVSPYSYNFDITTASPVNLDMAATVFNDVEGSAPVCKSSPFSAWLTCSVATSGNMQHSFVNVSSDVTNPVIRVYNDIKYIFWIEKKNGKYGLYYTKILADDSKEYDNALVYSSYNSLKLESVIRNDNTLYLWVTSPVNTTLFSLGLTDITPTTENTYTVRSMSRQPTAILGGKIIEAYSDGSGTHYLYDGSVTDLSATAGNVSVASNDELAMLLWRNPSNLILYYKLINASKNEITSGTIANAHASGDVAVVAGSGSFYLSWIDNTDGYDKVYYKYLNISTFISCGAEVAASCVYMFNNTYNVTAVVTWHGSEDSFMLLEGNLTGPNAVRSYSANQITDSPYTTWFNVSGSGTTPTSFNITLNAAVFVEGPGGGNVVACRSSLPNYWLACKKPSYSEAVQDVDYTSSEISQKVDALQTHMNAMLGATLGNSSKTSAVSSSGNLQTAVSVRRQLNITSDSSSKMIMSITYNGTTNVTNFFVFDVVPKLFATNVNKISVSNTGGSRRTVLSDPEYIFYYEDVEPGDVMVIEYDVGHYANVSISAFSEPFILTASATGTTTSTQTTINQTTSSSTSTVSEDCAPGCPDVYLGDDECDVACNNAACNYDDGDCTAGTTTSTTGGGSEEEDGLLVPLIIIVIIVVLLVLFWKKVLFFVKYITS